jgi:mono/diheme cytochrome c family protein
MALVGAAGAVYSAEKADFGKREYDSNCASCHGLKGKGDGPYKPFLNKSPSDLTTLSKRNSGVFPFDRVYMTIDGRLEVKAHGPGDMPIWGAAYTSRAASDHMDVPYHSESYVRTRILALTEYVFRLQAK